MIVTAILINILNPKLSIFFFAFLPQFVDADDPHPLSRMLELSARLHGDDLRGVRGLRPVRRRRPRPRDLAPAVLTWLRRSFAAAFAALGAKLALSER